MKQALLKGGATVGRTAATLLVVGAFLVFRGFGVGDVAAEWVD